MRRPLSCLCLLIIMLVQLRMLFAEEAPLLERIETIEISGQIYEKEQNKIYLTSISIQQDSKTNQEQITQNDRLCKKRIVVELPGGETYKLGSTVTVQGTFLPFLSATNPGEFNQKDYYDTLGIVGTVKNAIVLKCSSSYSIIKKGLYGIRQSFKNRLYAVFPQKEASILAAMLLGEKKELDRDVKALYRENGILHILSISGVYTLSLVYITLCKTPIFCPFWAF